MKSAFVSLAILLGNVCGANELSLTIRETNQNGTFVIDASIANVSNQRITVPLLFISEDYYIRFDIRDRSGNKAKFIGPEIDWRSSPKDYLGMFPESRYIQKIDLSQYYQLEDICYTVTATYDVADWRWEEDFIWHGVLYSNEIKVNCNSEQKETGFRP